MAHDSFFDSFLLFMLSWHDSFTGDTLDLLSQLQRLSDLNTVLKLLFNVIIFQI